MEGLCTWNETEYNGYGGPRLDSTSAVVKPACPSWLLSPKYELFTPLSRDSTYGSHTVALLYTFRTFCGHGGLFYLMTLRLIPKPFTTLEELATRLRR